MTTQNELPYWILVEYQAMEKDLAELHERLRNLNHRAMDFVGKSFMDQVREGVHLLPKGASFNSSDLAKEMGLQEEPKVMQIATYLNRLSKKPNSGLEKVAGMRGRYRCL